jgi:lipid II:glycine glycyltransferase (peptidoglycan interpeptide bridge formation enzyme)
LIEVLKKNGPVLVTERWFSNTVKPTGFWRPLVYVQCKDQRPYFGFLRKKFETKVIDLSRSEEQLELACEKATQYEVRRSRKDGVEIIRSIDIDEFVLSYNAFSRQRGVEILSKQKIEHFQPFLRLNAAKLQDKILAVHAYIVDEESGRCRLLYSASDFRADNDTKWRATVGRANRHLHWDSLIHFKNKGLLIYDLGGYAVNSKDPALVGINSFKDSFGGHLVEESHYVSWALVLLQYVKKTIQRPEIRVDAH